MTKTKAVLYDNAGLRKLLNEGKRQCCKRERNTQSCTARLRKQKVHEFRNLTDKWLTVIIVSNPIGLGEAVYSKSTRISMAKIEKLAAGGVSIWRNDQTNEGHGELRRGEKPNEGGIHEAHTHNEMEHLQGYLPRQREQFQG